MDVACDFGEEFVGGDAGGCGEGGFFEDAAADFVGDECCAALEMLAVGDVDEGFVEGEGFDDVGELTEDGVDDLAGFVILFDVGGDDDQVRAQAQGVAGGHGGADAEFAGGVV